MLRSLISFLIVAITVCSAQAQAMYFNNAKMESNDSVAQPSLATKITSLINSGVQDTTVIEEVEAIVYDCVADSVLAEVYAPEQWMSLAPLPEMLAVPAIFSYYELPDTTSIFTPDYSGVESLRWLEDLQASNHRYRQALRQLAVTNPWAIRYNRRLLPDAPQEFIAADLKPTDFTLNVTGSATNVNNSTTLVAEAVNRKHWVKNFNASLQFSQAYVSPNWYQGGNNNVNSLLNIYYNVKLNQAFHPKLLFETTFQYKLGMNSAPDDSLRNYNISEDLLQVNSVFGIKAIDKWYYSLTGQFKTQMLNAYKTNSNVLRSAFLSPAELNLGLGMTYSTTNKKKTLSFDANVSPLSYNMMICTNRRMNETSYGITEGHSTAHKFGSKMECVLKWQMAYNISLRSRLFGFTDYDRAYFDWENTLTFEINRFITTTLYVHLRYDTDTPKVENEHWNKLQCKEILSLGFAYTFKSL